MDRDNSLDAINKRYIKSNELAIITHNRIIFDSLRDLHYLMNLVKQLQEENEKLRSELQVHTSNN